MPSPGDLPNQGTEPRSLALWEDYLPSEPLRTPMLRLHNARDLDLIPGLGRSPEGGKGNPLQYSFLENFMDREA